jgi:folate-binding protein YgfZ
MSEASYGDVTAEYMALRTGAGLVRPGADLVWVRGPDAVSFLDGLLSQDIAGMAEGSIGRSFLLEPRGKLVELLWVLRGNDEVGLLAGPGRGPHLEGALQRFKFRVDAVLEAGGASAEVWGQGAAKALAQAALPIPDGWARVGDNLVAAVPMAGLPRYVVNRSGEADLESAGARPAGRIAATTVRIEAGEPLMGVDVDEKTIPQETGLTAASVSFTKGCYLGQELVARIDSRGRVNRHLRGLTLSDNVIPPEGAAVFAGDLEAGAITSVGESLTMRAPVALAILRREAEPDMTVEIRWDGGAATAIVREVPLDDFARS